MDTTTLQKFISGVISGILTLRGVEHKEANVSIASLNSRSIAVPTRVADSGYRFRGVSIRYRCGVLLASGIGGLNEIEEQIDRGLLQFKRSQVG